MVALKKARGFRDALVITTKVPVISTNVSKIAGFTHGVGNFPAPAMTWECYVANVLVNSC